MSDKILYYTKMETPIGALGLISSQKGLLRVIFSPLFEKTALRKSFPNSKLIASQTHHKKAIAQLHEYFQGKRKEFSLGLDLRGTPFQIQVWHALQKVPYGKTRTYGEIARKIKKPNAFRAVGNACRANPIPIIIPCHRIVGKNGELTGFAAGLEIKRQLLALESKIIP